MTNVTITPGTATFLMGEEPISVPIPDLDAFYDEKISIASNYSVQLGAVLIVLIVMLVMTPIAKLRRLYSMLLLAGLVICITRQGFMVADGLGPYNHFYENWTQDESLIPWFYSCRTVVAHVFSLLLVLVIQVILMQQAWTMVSLWPLTVKVSLVCLSALISLVAIGWRFAFSVMQMKYALGLLQARDYIWLIYTALIVNTLAMSWYCALFNVKLVLHLLANRGILSASTQLTPMEVLIMTNGILMIVPGLEWANFTNFEAASLSQSSVVIILPIGTLAAQQLTARTNLTGVRGNDDTSGGVSKQGGRQDKEAPRFKALATNGASDTSGNGGLQSPNNMSTNRSPRPDHFDWELQQIDSEGGNTDLIERSDTDLQQKEISA